MLDNGYTLDTDLVVLTAGGRPSTALARRAGLTVRRGIVVDDRLRSVDDAHVHAIGDCAEHAGRTTGFVPPAWEQAGAARRAPVRRATSPYDGSRSVARLRATDLDVAVLGDPERAEGEVVEMTNPVVGTHRKLVVRDGVIVGGHPGRRPVPDRPDHPALRPAARSSARTSPGALLLGDRPGDRPAQLPDDAEVCACAGVTAGRIRACASLDDVRETTRATTGCGGCAPPSASSSLSVRRSAPPWKEPAR